MVSKKLEGIDPKSVKISSGGEDCPKSVTETKGPFGTKTPAELIKENIIVDRKGIPMVMKFVIKNRDWGCQPYDKAIVDVWHCDAEGYYSEYGNHRMQRQDFRDHHFLRGRQTTDSRGEVSFVSVFPGWYPGRAPHIHLEIFDKNEKSLLVTQVAFEENICNEVYKTKFYRGPADRTNERDGVFRNSLASNMSDRLYGNIHDGYILEKTLIV